MTVVILSPVEQPGEPPQDVNWEGLALNLLNLLDAVECRTNDPAVLALMGERFAWAQHSGLRVRLLGPTSGALH